MHTEDTAQRCRAGRARRHSCYLDDHFPPLVRRSLLGRACPPARPHLLETPEPPRGGCGGIGPGDFSSRGILCQRCLVNLANAGRADGLAVNGLKYVLQWPPVAFLDDSPDSFHVLVRHAVLKNFESANPNFGKGVPHVGGPELPHFDVETFQLQDDLKRPRSPDFVQGIEFSVAVLYLENHLKSTNRIH